MRRRQLVIRACTVAVTIAIAAAGMRTVTKNEVSAESVPAITISISTEEQIQVASTLSDTGRTVEAMEQLLLIKDDTEEKSSTKATAVPALADFENGETKAELDTEPLLELTADSMTTKIAEPVSVMLSPETVDKRKSTGTVTTDAVAEIAAALITTETKDVVTVSQESETKDETNVAEVSEETSEAETDVTGTESEETVNKQEVAIEEAVEPEDEFANLVIAQVNDYVNVRSLPNTESDIVGKLYDDSVGTLISESDDGWYEILSGEVQGYVKAEYCVTGEDANALVDKVGTRIATIMTEGLRVRTDATLDASVLGMVPLGEELTVLEEKDGWVKISIEEGDGYVSGEYVELRTEFVSAESKAQEEARLAKEAEARKKAQDAARKKAEAEAATASKETAPVAVPTISGDSSMGASVAQYACKFVGNPYVYGGSSLTNGTDCSGFVMSVYSNFGVSLPHSSTSDRTQGYAVDSIDSAQPGDLICYSGHVALYIGNGQIVHASSKRTGIIISDAGYKKILAIRRIF